MIGAHSILLDLLLQLWSPFSCHHTFHFLVFWMEDPEMANKFALRYPRHLRESMFTSFKFRMLGRYLVLRSCDVAIIWSDVTRYPFYSNVLFLCSKLQKRMSKLQAYCMVNIMECNCTCVDNCLDSLNWFQWKEMISFNVVFYDDTTNRWRTKYQVVPSENVGTQQRFVWKQTTSADQNLGNSKSQISFEPLPSKVQKHTRSKLRDLTS